MNENDTWLNWALFLADRLENKRKGSLSELWTYFSNGAYYKKNGQILDFIQESDQAMVPIGSVWYPAELLELQDPPLLLFLKGDRELLRTPRLAIVGTRKATPLGRKRTHIWAKHLTSKNWTIVSGLAMGIDQAAQSGALPRTISLLAFGHHHHYPKENFFLRQKIEKEGGLTISAKLPWEGVGHPRSFLERNLLIAALSQKVIVVEAPRKSGSIHTALTALDMGRDVYVVPGNPEQVHYVGSIHLIQQGAWPLFHPDEIENNAISLPKN